MFSFSVNRPVSVSMMILAVIILGLYLGSQLNIDLFPKLDVPIVTITTQYLGVGPEEIEEQVSKKIEDAVGTVGGLKSISSNSMEGASVVTVEFEYGTDLNVAVSDIREKLDGISGDLPTDAKAPVVIKMDPAQAPILQLVLSGSMDQRQMRALADDDLKKRLEQVKGVASVRIVGGLERQIRVVLNRDRLDEYRITAAQVAQSLRAENINVPGGRITTDSFEIQIRSVGEFAKPSEISDILVGTAGTRPIHMRDIAHIVDIYKDKRSESRLDGVPCVSIKIQRNTDANTVAVADAVRKEVDRINGDLPAGLKLSVVFDSSKYIRQSIKNMWEEAFEGGILAIIVIFVFLGSGRSTGVIALSLPTSIIATFLLMYFNKLSVNLITLAGFIMGIGRIVDDSIVVLENIFRHVEKGKPPMQAAVEGAQEVGLAVMASTLTTISVFMPLFLVGGLIGQMFSNLSKTFAFSLLASLGVAVTLIPMLSARVIHVPGEGEKKSLFRRIYDAWERVWKSIERLYRSALRWALAHRSAVVTAAVSLLIASFAIPSYVGAEFAPKMDHGEMFINVTSPVGSSFAYTDGIARQIEKILKDRVPEVEHVTADVGIPPTGSMFSTSTVTIEKPDMCGINVSLKEKSQGRTRSVFTIQDELRPLLVRIPGADIRIQEVRGLSNKADLEVILKGYDLKVLASKGEELKKIVSYIPGAADLDLNWRSGNPEYRISLDRERAGEHGLNLGQVAAAVRTLILGENVTKYKEKGKEYDITLQLPSLQRQNIEDIQSIRIPAAGGAQVSLQDVADVTLQTGPSSISRRDRSRCVILQGNATGRSMGEIVAEIKEKIPSLSLPSGYRWAIEGQEKERDESFAKLWAALALGVLLVYVILASQFESFVHPFTIMLAIPLELVGVFLAMLIFREPMSIMIILGMIMLTGIVVSNSILLVNYIIVLRNSGKKRLEAVLEAGPVRLRPILMTALATVIAMVPMAMGLREGQEFFAPLGKVVIGGLLTSTFFTLLVVPVAYTLLDDVGRRLGLARKED